MAEVNREFWRSSCPVLVSLQVHLQQVFPDHVKSDFEYVGGTMTSLEQTCSSAWPPSHQRSFFLCLNKNDFYRLTDWGWERPPRGHWVQSMTDHHLVNQTRGLSSMSSNFLNMSRDSDSTTSLDSSFQCSTIISVKEFFPMSILNLPWHSLRFLGFFFKSSVNIL